MHRVARLALLTSSLAASGGTCFPSSPLAPSPGAPQYRAPARVAVPGGVVDVAGGNLLVMRSDLDLDTQLGPFAVGAVWSSATRRWSWSFDDLSYANGRFIDPTGAIYDVASLAPGAAIPGTVWVKLGEYEQSGANTIQTKGGLEYDFTGDGRILAMRWTSSNDPQLRFTQAQQGDGRLHTTAIEQCLAPAHDCHPVFAIRYDAQGRVVQITDRAGRQALFGYDAVGHLATARDGLDVARGWPGFRYEYAGGDLAAIASSEGERTQYRYDGAHRVTEIAQIGPGSPTRSFAYQPAGGGGLYATTYTDPLGSATRFRYDASGQVVEVTALATGDTVTRTWQDRRVTSLTLPSGVTTLWSYRDDDVAARLDPSGNATRYAYQPGGVDRSLPTERAIQSVSDRLGPLEQRSYDAAGRLLSITNGAGETTRLDYGGDEMIRQASDPAGVSTALSGYGEHGHATRATLGGITRSFTYDAVGDLVQGPDLQSESGPGRGGIVSRSFDEDRNVASVQLADLIAPFPQSSATLNLEHRSDHRLLAIQRPGGGDARFHYDALGRLVQRDDRAEGVWRTTGLAYDAVGRVTALDRPNGMGESWSYDALGRGVLHRILRGGAQEGFAGFTWSRGRVTSMLDLRSGSETYAYDDAGRVGAVTYGNGERTEIAWDLRSRMVGAVLRRSDGSVLRALGLGYDAAGREAAVYDGGVALVQRIFVDARLVQTRYANGLTRSFAYDAARGTLSGVSMATAGSAMIESSAVQYADPVCNFTEQCITAQSESYGVLAASSYEKYWLMPVEGPGLDVAGKRVGAQGADARLLSYDVLGNRIGEPGFEYDDEGNRLLAVRDASGTESTAYGYDAAGFCTARGGVAIGWDGAGRIASLGSAGWVWDALGRLVSSTQGGVVTGRRFGGLVETDAAGNPQAIDLGEVRIDLAGSATRYRHFDFRGNVKLVSDAGGQLVEHYQYAPYGIDRSFGPDLDSPSFARGRRVGDLFVLGHRLYDPAAGRFLAPDPIYQLINQYAYALANPARLWDPAGAESLAVDAATALAGFAGSRIGQAVGAATGAEWGAVIGGLAAGPVGVGAGAAIGGFLGGAVGGAYGGAGAANLVYEALTGEQLFGFAPFAPGSGGAGGGAGAVGAAPALPRGGEADVDRGYPIPSAHPCNGDACPVRRGTGNGGGRFVSPPSGGTDTGQCAPVALGRARDVRLYAALLVANAALAVWIAVVRRRARG